MQPVKHRPAPRVVALLAIVAGLAAVTALRDPAIEQWFIWRLGSQDRALWSDAAERLLAGRSQRALPRIAAAALERDTEKFDVWQTRIFEMHGSRAVLALPGYRDGLRHERLEVRHQALKALRDERWRRPEVVPLLVETLASPDPVLRWQSAHVLAELGAGAAAAVPALLETLRDPEKDVRWACVVALGSMAPALGAPPAGLIRALADPESLVACQAARALAVWGPRAEGAVPALIEALSRRNTLRWDAAITLGAIGPEARQAIPALVAAIEAGPWRSPLWGPIRQEDGPRDLQALEEVIPFKERGDAGRELRCEAIGALRAIGADLRELRPFLKKLLGSGSSLIDATASVLRSDPVAASGLIPELIGALGAAQSYHNAFDALVRVGPPAVDLLLEAMRTGQPRIRAGAAMALASMNPVSAPVLTALRNATEREEHAVKPEFLHALRIADPGFNLMPALLEWVRADKGRDWTAAAGGLFHEVGREAAPYLPDVLEWLRSEKGERAWGAEAVLASMAIELPEALPHVVERLRAATPGNMSQVLVAGLAGAVHSPDVVLPALRDIVKRDEGTDRVRLNVLWPLRAFGRRAVPVLEEILSGPPGDVMEQACRALADVAPEHPWVLERLERAVTEGGNASEAEQILASMLELDRVPAGARALLRAASSRPELPLRLRAARVLLRTGGADETLLPLLREGLTDHWYADGPLYWRGPLCNPARREAVRVLAEIGPAGKALLPELRACLEYPDGLLRLLAAEALWKLTGELRVEVLLEALDKAVQWRLEWPRLHEILPILTAAGPAAREAAPYLEPLLASPFLEMERERVQAALAAIRGGESPATE